MSLFTIGLLPLSSIITRLNFTDGPGSGLRLQNLAITCDYPERIIHSAKQAKSLVKDSRNHQDDRPKRCSQIDKTLTRASAAINYEDASSLLCHYER